MCCCYRWEIAKTFPLIYVKDGFAYGSQRFDDVGAAMWTGHFACWKNDSPDWSNRTVTFKGFHGASATAVAATGTSQVSK